MKKNNLYDLSFDDLCAYLKSIGSPAFHAKQIFSWIYQRNISAFDSMTDLPKELRDKISEHYDIGRSQVLKEVTADDESVKVLIELYDRNVIEAVLIRKGKRRTVCVSSQAGCKFGCLFCASGIGGWNRNLTQGEILEQIMLVQRKTQENITHVVFMGTGEPFDNWENVKKAIEVINFPQGMNIAARRITISTCGVLAGIKELKDFKKQAELAVSLHGYNDDVREQLMPINKVYPLAELISACKEYIKETNRQITFEYVLIDGLTCCDEAPKALGRLLKGMKCKLNLIPYNSVEEFEWKTPSRNMCYRFRDALMEKGVYATIRWSKGKGSTGACGQLRWSRARKEKK